MGIQRYQEVKNMTEKKTGEIIFSHIGNIPATGETYGLLTIRTPDDESMELKINDSTQFNELKIGNKVEVAIDEIENEKYPIVKDVKIIS
jgi:hypothetical protein